MKYLLLLSAFLLSSCAAQYIDRRVPQIEVRESPYIDGYAGSSFNSRSEVIRIIVAFDKIPESGLVRFKQNIVSGKYKGASYVQMICYDSYVYIGHTNFPPYNNHIYDILGLKFIDPIGRGFLKGSEFRFIEDRLSDNSPCSDE